MENLTICSFNSKELLTNSSCNCNVLSIFSGTFQKLELCILDIVNSQLLTNILWASVNGLKNDLKLLKKSIIFTYMGLFYAVYFILKLIYDTKLSLLLKNDLLKNITL